MRSYIYVDKNVEKDKTFPFLKLLNLFFDKNGVFRYWKLVGIFIPFS